MAECEMDTTPFQLEVPALVDTGPSRKKGGSLKYELYGKRSSLVDRDPAEIRSYKWSSLRIGRRHGSEKRESIVRIESSANGGPFSAAPQPIKAIGKQVSIAVTCDVT
jgi:hypothetical protein